MRLLLLISCALWGCLSDASCAGDAVKIGIIAPLSGLHANDGFEFIEGSKTGINGVGGGIGFEGKPVEFVILDTQCDPSSAAQGAGRLVENENVSIALELSCGRSTLVTSRVFQEMSVPHLVFNQSGIEELDTLAGVGSAISEDVVPLENFIQSMQNNQKLATEMALGGHTLVEILIETIKEAGSIDADELNKVLRSRTVLTSAGGVKFEPLGDGDSTSSSTFSLELWAKKRDCPKCPKSGACPQALEVMLSAKKTCN